jgi:hypothetical protein
MIPIAMVSNPQLAHSVGISKDIEVGAEDFSRMKNALQEWCPGVNLDSFSVKEMGLASYLRQIKSYDLVVILFAGYNVERYGPNLWKHLCFFFGPLYGVNIEGHIFRIPRIRVSALLIREWFLKGCSLLLGKFYEMALSRKSTTSSCPARPDR